MEANGRALIEGRRRLDVGEAAWMAELAEFDSGGWWVLDGHLSCVAWLVQHCGMAYSTAKDKVRVASELRRRPLLAEAFAAGDVSYCKVRALTRITGADQETDEALLAAARRTDVTVADLEEAVRRRRLHDEQNNPTRAMKRWQRRGVRRLTRFGGMSIVEICHLTEDTERMFSIIDAYLTSRALGEGVDKDSREAGDSGGTAPDSPPVDKDSCESGAEDPIGARTWAQRRADALIELLEAGLAHFAAGGEIDPERAIVDVAVDYGTLCERAGGTAQLAGAVPLSGEAARRLACDAGLCRIIIRGKSEVLDVGRKSRSWTRAQRRAIKFRHGGRCAFPACERRIVQIHHTTPWEDEGKTDLDAGVPVCWGHHHLVHEGGWTVTYDGPTSTAVFTSPTGDHICAPLPAWLASAA